MEDEKVHKSMISERSWRNGNINGGLKYMVDEIEKEQKIKKNKGQRQKRNKEEGIRVRGMTL